jgi:hypothetical protein
LTEPRSSSYTNTGGPVSGNIMLGYCDPANSVAPQASSVIYANARVIRLVSSTAAANITSIVRNGGNYDISYTGGNRALVRLESHRHQFHGHWDVLCVGGHAGILSHKERTTRGFGNEA